MAGTVERGTIRIQPAHRFANGVIERDGHLRWDIGSLFEQVRTGLARIPDATSIGIDTWAVDYGLLDADGHLLADPIAYRDDRTADVIDEVHAVIPPEELFAINGVQHLPFNTVYQLVAEQRGPCWDEAVHAVLLPDLLAFWLTGVLRTELTNASTTGLLDVRTRKWSPSVFDRLGIPATLLPELESPGVVRGTVLGGAVPLTTVASHDTASAVVGVPATTDRFAYIAIGTWSLVGLELDGPVLTDAARAANFTNELGVNDRIRFLRNVGGLWLLQECLREWQRGDIDELLLGAARLPKGGPTVDVDAPTFLAPGGMHARIRSQAGGPLDQAATVRCILDSLAAAYSRTVHQAASLAGTEVEVVHMVGGGSQNHLLCQLTADATGIPVIAGPVEASSIGNITIQARCHDAVPASLEAIRAGIAASTPLRRYQPS